MFAKNFAAKPVNFIAGRGQRSGAAAVEFALIAPFLIVLLWGIISYGGYFMTMHTLQQIANDAARAAIAGLDDTERLALARDSVKRQAVAYLGVGQAPTVALSNDGRLIRIDVRYDASQNPYWVFGTLFPMPSPNLSRSGAVLMGGF